MNYNILLELFIPLSEMNAKQYLHQIDFSASSKSQIIVKTIKLYQ